MQKEDFSESLIQKVLTKEYMTHPKYILYNLHVFPWESDFLFYYAYSNWRERCMERHDTERKLRGEIASLKTEYKAVTGETIQESAC